MRSNRLGCLSGTGIVAALVTAFVIVGMVYARGGVMFSPGPLNAEAGEMLGGVTSHAATGGECKACHTAPWESGGMEDRCVDCHGVIAAQMQDVATMHGSILTDKPDLRCRFCHPEHRGPDAPLTELGEQEGNLLAFTRQRPAGAQRLVQRLLDQPGDFRFVGNVESRVHVRLEGELPQQREAEGVDRADRNLVQPIPQLAPPRCRCRRWCTWTSS